jgi:hypothetical protein
LKNKISKDFQKKAAAKKQKQIIHGVLYWHVGGVLGAVAIVCTQTQNAHADARGAPNYLLCARTHFQKAAQ